MLSIYSATTVTTLGKYVLTLQNNALQNEYVTTLLLRTWNVTGEWYHEYNTSINLEIDGTLARICPRSRGIVKFKIVPHF